LKYQIVCHSRVNGNPDAVPVEAGNYTKIIWIPCQARNDKYNIDSCFSMNDTASAIIFQNSQIKINLPQKNTKKYKNEINRDAQDI